MNESDKRFFKGLAFWCTFVAVAIAGGVDIWKQRKDAQRAEEEEQRTVERRAHLDTIQKDAADSRQRMEAQLQEIIKRLPPR